MSNGNLQKRGVAYNEAGHAVVAHELGGTVINVKIVQGQAGWKGATHVELNKGDDVGKAAYYAAGVIAQEKGASGSQGLFTDQGDVDELNKLANKIGNPALIGPFAAKEDKAKRQEFLDNANHRAEEIIARRWDDVKSVAEALITSSELDQQQFERLVAKNKS